VRFKNIDALVRAGVEITIWRIGQIRCGATATDEDQSLAMLARRPGDSLEELLGRLDRAIVKAWDGDKYIDEINELRL